MNASFAGYQAAPTMESTRTLLGNLFRYQIRGLYVLIEQFGGEKLASKLDQNVSAASALKNLPLVISQGKVKKLNTQLPWTVYADVMEEAIDFSVSVAGRQLVTRRVKAITEGLEQRSGVSYFEIAFRLGLHRLKS